MGRAFFACEGKSRFSVWRAARFAMRRHRLEAHHVYMCPHCHFWHVGSARKRPRRKRSPPRVRVVLEENEDDRGSVIRAFDLVGSSFDRGERCPSFDSI